MENEKETGAEARRKLKVLADSASRLREAISSLGPLAAGLLEAVMAGGDITKFDLLNEWPSSLTALEAEARSVDRFIGQSVCRGGKISMHARLHGSAEDTLAHECQKIAKVYGCKSQAVILRIVQAVMETEYGSHDMKKVDGKLSKDKGRKAVRKLARTVQKYGTV